MKLSVDTTCIILLLFPIFLPVASSTEDPVRRLIRRRRYEAVTTKRGIKQCALDSPFQTFTSVRTRLACSAKCAQISDCVGFNFWRKNHTCEIFLTDPSNFGTVDNCEHYQQSGVPATSCSFPFTLNGQLYHQCTPEDDDERAYGEVGCFLEGRTWVNCLAPKDFVAIPEAEDITIRENGEPSNKKVSVLTIQNWIVISQRIDGSLSFNLKWNDYKKGFGTFDGTTSNFWLGNEKLNQLTNQHDSMYLLRVEFQFTDTGDWYSAEYDSFSVDEEDEGYKLTLGGFSGDVGDALSQPGGANGMKFSTSDRDNDLAAGLNCAKEYSCGWWMNQCFTANPNGLYGTGGMSWNATDDSSPEGAIREVRMMIRKQED